MGGLTMIEAVTVVCVFVWVVSRLHRRNAPPSLGSVGEGEQVMTLLPLHSIQRKGRLP